jgi:hypothetical protein
MLVNYSFQQSNSDSPVWQLAAFWPVTPILTSTGNGSSSDPNLHWKDSAWMITSIIYLFIAFIALARADAVYKKSGGVTQEDE